MTRSFLQIDLLISSNDAQVLRECGLQQFRIRCRQYGSLMLWIIVPLCLPAVERFLTHISAFIFRSSNATGKRRKNDGIALLAFMSSGRDSDRRTCQIFISVQPTLHMYLCASRNRNKKLACPKASPSQSSLIQDSLLFSRSLKYQRCTLLGF